MSPNPDLKIPPAQVAAALAVGTVAVLMVGVQPIVLGELVEARQVSLAGVGIVAMAEIIMLGLGVLLGDAFLPGARLRLITIVAALCAASLDIFTVLTTGDVAMTAVRAAAGLAEGVLIWGTTGVIVRTANPARIGAVFFIAQTLAQALLGLSLANAIIPHWGWQGGFMAMGLLALLPCLLAFMQPSRLSPLQPPAVSGFRWSGVTLIPLGIAFLQLAALGSFWAYLEPLGKVAGLDARAAQTLISAVLVMQVVGGCVAALMASRLRVLPTLVTCSLLLAAVTTTIYQLPAGSSGGFALACAVFGFVWLFMLPFHIGLAFQADSSGRLAGLVPAAQLLGCAFGPLTASFVVDGENANAIPLLSAGLAVAATALMLATLGHRSAKTKSVVS